MDQRFPYAAKRGTALLGVVFALAVIAYSVFSLGTGGVITRRRGRADLSPEFSQAVFIVLVLIALGVLVWAVRKLTSGQLAVVVTPEQLELPASPTSKKTITLPVAGIRELIEHSSSAQGHTLTITSEGHKPVLLQASSFESPQVFASCHQAIQDARRAISS